MEDIEDEDNSILLDLKTIKEISSHSSEMEAVMALTQNKSMLRQIILKAFKQFPDFDITKFDLSINEEDRVYIDKAIEFFSKYCEGIYHHLHGIAHQLDENDFSNDYIIRKFKEDSANRHSNRMQSIDKDGKPKAKLDSKALAMMKGVDFKNNRSISFWLANLYSKDRAKMFREGKSKARDSFHPGEWWRNNKYGEFVKQWPRTFDLIEAAIKDFNNRILPPMNFNCTVFPIICDKLNDFAEYAVMFEEIAYTIKRNMITRKDKYPPPPVQIGMYKCIIYSCFKYN